MNELRQKRIEAAFASKGISSPPIKNLALRLISQNFSGGSILDFGAGKGDLVQLISRNFDFRKIVGVDIYPKPQSLPQNAEWYEFDLNKEFQIQEKFDIVVATEVIEHLENPRATFRCVNNLLRNNGIFILTTPNQNSLRSILAFLLKGHFAAFLGDSYPAHITALTHLDLKRISKESKFEILGFYYTNHGGIPKRPSLKWQTVSFGLLKGRLFSDNLALVAKKLEDLK